MRRFSLIPKPNNITELGGHFEIPSQLSIACSVKTEFEALDFQDFVQDKIGISCQINTESPQGNITLDLVPEQGAGTEAYQLQIDPKAITITAISKAGIFYGLQTFIQLLFHFESEGQIPCLKIEDGPRYSWRGFMLDEARHFQGKDQVKRLLNIMAHYKMNVFHWHLTDDQGWRIEIKEYPRLTEIGAVRPGTSYSFFNKKHNNIPHSGFYTQEDISEIVAYAAERHITIVPEIDLPGHSHAALAAYPEFSCTKKSFSPATGPGIYKDIFCVGKEATFKFLEKVFHEVLLLFPSEFVHIGGDESPKNRWKECPDCQSRANDLGIDSQDLQVYFTNRMVKYLKSQGKRVIGWSEVFQEGVDHDVIIQSWLPRSREIIRAVQDKKKLIVSLMTATYLDQTYQFIPLEKAYSFNPMGKGLSHEDREQVLGIEAPLWTEFVWNSARLDYQTFPRLFAYAETGWTITDQKNYPDFEKRLRTHLPRLDDQGFKYAPPTDWNPPFWKNIQGIFSVVKAKNLISTGKADFPV